MQIYIQEISSTVFFPRLPSSVKARIINLAHAFPELLKKVKVFTDAGIPETAWYFLLKTETDGKNGTNVPGRANAAPCSTKRENQTYREAKEK